MLMLASVTLAWLALALPVGMLIGHVLAHDAESTARSESTPPTHQVLETSKGLIGVPSY